MQSYLPESPFFQEDQVNQGDQEDPISERERDKEKKKGMLVRDRERETERETEGRGKRKERYSMLMASNNMQFTVQTSAMMSMCYIYVRAMEFKERSQVCSTKCCTGNFLSRRVKLHSQDDTDTSSHWFAYGANVISHHGTTWHETCGACYVLH